ncbi:Uncharacterized protein TOPH_06288 [Tolypocladium ophioglossoides CBS 100239]|uniref:Transcriptional regulator n=1 Tax=Tolypocladium ophioglossoides (strain CBS 100239) TaxID=1163406 RepID=A0A0L0N4Z2_TOLOC|nr:Uncharacterized protein TOPH_06288 [Tolypocladium ophioglossoides CBS 100239]
MHLRKDHAELNIPALRQFIRSNPLGLLTTAITSPSSSFPLLQSTHIPFILDVDDESSQTELGRLRGHMARQNPQSKALVEALGDPSSPRPGSNVLAQDVLIVFTSPVQHYITTNFYSETMSGDKKTAPTWNYSAVQVYGRARIHYDADAPATADFLMKQLADLSRMGETGIMGYSGAEAWTVADAPSSYVERSRRYIIGLEISMHRLEGKVKMSQELKPRDREGVVRGLKALRTETAEKMAVLVEERAALKLRPRVDAIES